VGDVDRRARRGAELAQFLHQQVGDRWPLRSASARSASPKAVSMTRAHTGNWRTRAQKAGVPEVSPLKTRRHGPHPPHSPGPARCAVPAGPRPGSRRGHPRRSPAGAA
jgi:hypothetical protein